MGHIDQEHADKDLSYCGTIKRWTVGSRQLAGKIGPREQEDKAVLGFGHEAVAIAFYPIHRA